MRKWRLYACVALPCLALMGPATARADEASAIIDSVRAPEGVATTAMPDAAPMRVILSLPMRDKAGAARYIDAISNPASPQYGQHLTPEEFGARFGGDRLLYGYLRSWAIAHGLTVGAETQSHTTLSLSGTAGQFARLFATKFASFHTAARGDGHVMLTAPHLPAELAGRIEGVIGLSSAGQFAPLAKPLLGPHADFGSAPDGGYAPSDIITAYDISPQTSSSKTEIVAIFEQSSFRASQVKRFENQYHLPAVKLTVRAVNGAPLTVNHNVEPEDLLDIDALVGINPSIPQIIIYVDGKDSFQTALLDSLNQMASDNKAKTISISYGQDESMQGTSAIMAENTAFMQLASQGDSIFISSGDNGSAGRTGSGLHAPDPGSQPYITSVGGTSLNTNGAGGAWKSETAWSGSGGGVSSVWSIPSYQVVGGTSVAVANGGSSTNRNVPDIAADANPNTGFSIYDSDYGGFVTFGGTSLSAPLWAGMASIINSDRVAAGKSRLGFFNPLVYTLGENGSSFHDITVGSNGSPKYKAGKGYDNVTGFGSIDFSGLLPSLLQ